MKCSNCESEIKVNGRYFRAGKAGTIYCSKSCCYAAYKNYYTKKEVERTIEKHTRLK